MAAARSIGIVFLGLLLTGAEPAEDVPAESDAFCQAMIARLQDADPHQRWQAAFLLGEEGPAAVAAAPALVTALGDDRLDVRKEAAGALNQIGAAAVPALIDGLNRDDPVVRLFSARALGQIGSGGEKAVASLVAALSDADEFVQAEAAAALARMGRAGTDALTKVLSDPDPSIRAAAKVAIGDLPAPGWSLPEMLKSSDDDVRFPAAVKQWRVVRDPAALSVLVDVAKRQKVDSADDKDRNTLLAISRPDFLVPNLLQSLSYPNPAVRLLAVAELALLGPAARDAVGELTQAIRDVDVGVRRWAAIALARIGPDAKAAIPALELARTDEDPAVRFFAGEALKKIRGATP